MPMRATTIRFGEDLWDILEREATEQGMSAAQLIREAAIIRIAMLAARRGDTELDVSVETLAERARARRQEVSRPFEGELRDPERLAAVQRTGLLGGGADPTLDRIAEMARRVLDAPVALISLVDADRQVLVSRPGLKEPWASRGETPLSYSVCAETIVFREPLVLNDARSDDRVRNSPAVKELDVVGYLGIPLITYDEHVLGALCAIDERPRDWTPEQVELLETLARAALDHIELEAAET
jgi:GAF domain-containing protein